MWNRCRKLRYVAHSSLIICLKIALLTFLGTCIVRTKCILQIFCVHRRTFQPLGRSDYQCPPCASIYQVRNSPSEEQTNFFVLLCNQGIDIFEGTRKSMEDVIQQNVKTKCVYNSFKQNAEKSFYDCKMWRAKCHLLNIGFNEQKPTITFFGGYGSHCSTRKMSSDYDTKKPSHSLQKFLGQSQSPSSELEAKKAKIYPFVV